MESARDGIAIGVDTIDVHLGIEARIAGQCGYILAREGKASILYHHAFQLLLREVIGEADILQA